MEAYRDQYATLFNNGKKVVVIGISTDADTTLANWAHESGFPNLFASDPDQSRREALRLGRQRKASIRATCSSSDRTDKIASRMMKFNVLVGGRLHRAAVPTVAATLKSPGPIALATAIDAPAARSTESWH